MGEPSAALEYKKELRRVMAAVLDGEDINGFSQEEIRYLKECCDRGFIKGLVPLEMISRTVVEVQHDPVLTLEGAEFLDAVSKEESDAQERDKQRQPLQIFLKALKSLFRNAWAWFLAGGAILGFLVDWNSALELLRTLFE